MSSPVVHLNNKRRLHEGLAALAGCRQRQIARQLQAIYHEDALWRGPAPFETVHGLAAIEAGVWRPLMRAFSLLERRDMIVIAGRYADADQVAMLGHLCAVFEQPWLGIPPSGQPVWLRYGEVHTVEGGRIRRSTVLFDILDLMRQAGFWPVAPSLGIEGLWPSPITGDGLQFELQEAAQSAASLQQTLAMHATLADFDDKANLTRENLIRMPQSQHWHEKMMWYGPAGIGTTRGLAGFVEHHQLPFRRAFPNRSGGHHYVRIGDGPYSVTAGWPSVMAHHTGGNFMGTSPSGLEVGMRVMDFYLHHEGRIRENWVPLDIIHLLGQLGIDVFERLQPVFARRRRAAAAYRARQSH